MGVGRISWRMTERGWNDGGGMSTEDYQYVFVLTKAGRTYRYFGHHVSGLAFRHKGKIGIGMMVLFL